MNKINELIEKYEERLKSNPEFGTLLQEMIDDLVSLGGMTKQQIADSQRYGRKNYSN